MTTKAQLDITTDRSRGDRTAPYRSQRFLDPSWQRCGTPRGSDAFRPSA
jgi:hypothetical protein